MGYPWGLSDADFLGIYAAGIAAMTAEDEIEASFRGVISIENARQQLGWTPRYASLREGIEEYIASYRAFLGAERT